MASFDIDFLIEEYPGLTEIQAAQAFAEKNNYILILKYKHAYSASNEYTHIACCAIEEEVEAYFHSPNCKDIVILYDRRTREYFISEDYILLSKCRICQMTTSIESLTVNGGNNFYFCPKCGEMYCDECYCRLPLNPSVGYGMCPTCRITVKRAFPGAFGNS